VAKLIPTTPGMTIQEAMKLSPDLTQIYQGNETAKLLIDTAKGVEGLFRHASTHAAGVVICREPVTEYAPVQRVGDSPVTIQFEKDYVEKIGLLKMDFLGLRNLTVVDKCLKLIQRTRGVAIDLNALPLTDSSTYRLLQSGDAIGVFQLESSGMRKLLRDLHPDKLEDIISLVALYRPGPLQSGMADEFVRRRHGLAKITYLHADLEPILKGTYGIMLYQEQVMQIAMALAGFSPGQAEGLMKAMSKKIVAVMDKLKPEFMNGTRDRGVPQGAAEQIWEQMAAFASYGFNQSHSAAYAVLTYHTAYLKANYAPEFMATNLSTIMDRKDKLALYIEDCRRMKIGIRAPDINESEADFTVSVDPESGEPDSVRFGLAAIKNVSRNAIEVIVRAREAGGRFTAFTDFARRACAAADATALSRTAVECLIRAGAFDAIEPNRSALLAQVDGVLGAAATLRRDRAQGQVTLFEDDDSAAELALEIEPPSAGLVAEMTREEQLATEKDLLGVYVSDHPLTEHIEALRRQGAVPSDELSELQDRQEVTIGGIIATLTPRMTKKNQPMASVTLEDLRGSVTVAVFPKVYEACRAALQKDRIVLIKGKTNVRERLVEDEDGGSAVVEVHAEEVIPFHVSNGASHNGNGHSHARQPAVHVRLSQSRGNELRVLRGILAAHPGDSALVFHIQNGSRVERVLAGLRVQPTRKMLDDVQQIIGRGAAWVE
jgi:DNA polymerase-3 subunit alpha